MDYKIDVYNTHIELYPYTKGDLPVIEQMYTAQDKFSGADVPCGYLIHEGKLYLPRGTSISKLEDITQCKADIKKDSDPADNMSRKFYSVYEPRDEIQKNSIDFLKGDDHQLGLNLATGVGKTFCVAYASTELNLKTLIITPNESLKQQWLATYAKMFDYRPKNLMNIAGSNIMDAIMRDEVNEADVYFVNHQTLRSYLSQNSPFMLKSFFQKLKIGIKVYDEAHMEFSNILLMDTFSNTDRTWYLTATFGRSDKSEMQCFKRAFQSVIGYGEVESKALKRKHVIYHVVNVFSAITPRDRSWLMGYPGFTANKYGKYAFGLDKRDIVYKTILEILTKTKDLEGKTLIFVPLIDNVDEIVKRLKKDFPTKSVAAYHSKVPKDEKESAEKKDIIVSTIKSCGTGRDIKGLRSIICAEPVASKVVIEQTIGRLRPYAEDKDTYYWDIVDRSVPPITWWWKGRYKKIQELVKQTVFLDM